MRKILFNEDRQEEFLQKGYTKIPLLSQKEVDFILEELKNLKPDDNFNPDGKGLINVTYHVTPLDTNKEYKRKTHKLIHEIISPYIQKILVDYQILTCAFFVKPPQEGYLVPHQNWSFTEDINDTTVTVWCPLVDVNETNGTIQVVEGSHKIIPSIVGPLVPRLSMNFEEEIKTKYSTPICLKAGEGMVFDDSLFHWSSENNSDIPRYVIAVSCVPSDSKPVYYYFDNDKPEKGFEMFEINSDFFIEHMPFRMYERPADFKSSGFVENNNRVLTEQEFAELLKKGDEIRKKVYFPTETGNSAAAEKNKSGFMKNFGFLKRIFGKNI